VHGTDGVVAVSPAKYNVVLALEIMQIWQMASPVHHTSNAQVDGVRELWLLVVKENAKQEDEMGKVHGEDIAAAVSLAKYNVAHVHQIIKI